MELATRVFFPCCTLRVEMGSPPLWVAGGRAQASRSSLQVGGPIKLSPLDFPQTAQGPPAGAFGGGGGPF